MTDYAQAARYIAYFESFAPVAKWDVNAFRLGFGSDTKGAAQTPVKDGDTTTLSEALANLAARIPQYEKTIVGQVGSVWEKLPSCVQIALLSFAYNYGSLTPTLRDLIKPGASYVGIANAVAARSIDNKGINAARRFKEAGTILAAI